MRNFITFFHRRLLGLGPIRLSLGKESSEIEEELSNNFYKADVFEVAGDTYIKWRAGDIIFAILFLFVSSLFHLILFAFIVYIGFSLTSAAIALGALLFIFLISRIFIVSYRPTLRGFL